MIGSEVGSSNRVEVIPQLPPKSDEEKEKQCLSNPEEQ
jgi:hypothetical protein